MEIQIDFKQLAIAFVAGAVVEYIYDKVKYNTGITEQLNRKRNAKLSAAMVNGGYNELVTEEIALRDSRAQLSETLTAVARLKLKAQ